MQKLRRGHYEIATDTPRPLRVPPPSRNSRRRSDRPFVTASRRPPISEAIEPGQLFVASLPGRIVRHELRVPIRPVRIFLPGLGLMPAVCLGRPPQGVGQVRH
jgi:hypothetical protein